MNNQSLSVLLSAAQQKLKGRTPFVSGVPFLSAIAVWAIMSSFCFASSEPETVTPDEAKSMLVDRGVLNSEYDAESRRGTHALIRAIERADKRTIALLLRAGVPVNDTDSRQRYTPLMYACEKGDTNTVKALLAAGARADYVYQDGFIPKSALHLACAQGYAGCVKALLDAGADPNVGMKVKVYGGYSDSGSTPLLDACYGGHVSCVKLLLEAGAEVNTGSFPSPMWYARQSGNQECIDMLIQAGVKE